MTTQAGFVAIVGAPNAGKSTFLNGVLGQKIAIVTPKVQTTRFNIRGIYTADNTQIIFTDTPGIHKPRRDFDRAMVKAAHQAALDADAILLLVDAAKGFNEEALQIIEDLKIAKVPMVLALNKIDLLPQKENLLPLMQQAVDMDVFKKIYTISAKDMDGVEELLSELQSYMPESPYLYDEDQITDLPMRMLAAEITRERAFMLLQKELPYAMTVETVQYEAKDDGSVRIEQNLIVEREGQKKILLGKSGGMIKKIGEQARKLIAEAAGAKVHLFLKVKVRKGWDKNPHIIRELGLEPVKK